MWKNGSKHDPDTETYRYRYRYRYRSFYSFLNKVEIMLQATIINFKIKIIHLKNIYNKLKITFTSIATFYITGQGRTDENITYITITHYISLH